MAEVQAQRTLVKSPPELWAEVSDVSALSRHLGEFGEIRITRLKPETAVAWEGERASGTVELRASAWGTKVTLTAEVVTSTDEGQATGVEPREPVADPGPTGELQPGPEAAPAGELQPEPSAEPTGEPQPEPSAKPTGELQPEPSAEPGELRPEPDAEPADGVEPADAARRLMDVPDAAASRRAQGRRPGAWARWWARFSIRQLDTDPTTSSAPPPPSPPAPAHAEPEPLAAGSTVPQDETLTDGPQPRALNPVLPARRGVHPVQAQTVETAKTDEATPVPVPPVEPVEPATEPAEARAEQVLTNALEALGSAHHRPFSRG